MNGRGVCLGEQLSLLFSLIRPLPAIAAKLFFFFVCLFLFCFFCFVFLALLGF